MELHAAIGGVVFGCAVAAMSSGRCASSRGARTGGVALALAGVAAVASGFTVTGWRPEQVGDLIHQPRDRAHAIAGIVILVVAAVGMFARSARGRWGAVARAVLLGAAVAVVVGTGFLMLFDGSDRSDAAAQLLRLRRPVVQVPDPH